MAANRKRSLSSLLFFVVLLLIMFSLFLGVRFGNQTALNIQQTTTSLVASAIEFIFPSKPYSGGFENELEALRYENNELKAKLLAAVEYKNENQQLKELLSVVEPLPYEKLSGSVITSNHGDFSHSALIRIESRFPIERQQAVINAQGLVGRIIDISHDYARVLYLTDSLSRIPVMGSKSRQRAILAGNGSPKLHLMHLPEHVQFEPGELILTSGDDGHLPKGLQVGIIDNVDSEYITVRSLVNWSKLEYVSVLVKEKTQP